MCHSLAPSGQPGMMHKNFMRGKRLPVFAVRRTGREVLCLNSGALRGAGYEHTPAGIDGHVRDWQRIRIRDEDSPHAAIVDGQLLGSRVPADDGKESIGDHGLAAKLIQLILNLFIKN